jgi:hypothetical protein
MSPGHRLRTVSDLHASEARYRGRMVRVQISGADVDGEYVGSMGIGDTVRLVLITGGVHIITPAYPSETAVEVWKKED